MKRYGVLLCLIWVAFLAPAQSFTEFAVNPYGMGSFPNDLVVFNGKLYFTATDSAHGFEPWVTDETNNGTHLLADIFTGSGNSFPQSLTVDSAAGLLFFQADDSIHGAELWVTNGDSTRLLKDINPGQNPSTPQNLFVFNGKVFFQADDGAHGSELWVSDGTVAGTQMLKDINTAQSDSAGSFPSGFVVYNGALYFAANDGTHGTELWVTDGSAGGTHLVLDIYANSIGSFPLGFSVFNSNLYFSATDSANGTELWVTDGNTTQLVTDIYPGYQSSNPQGLTVFGDKLYFQANDGTHGVELWSLDALGGAPQLLSDIYPGASGSYPNGFIKYKNKLFFQATDSLHGSELWVTDGTNSGTILLTDIVAGTDGSFPRHFVNYHNNLYFIAQPDVTSGDQMFLTDGTAAGTTGLIFTGAPLNPLGASNGFTLYNNTLAFSAFYDFNAGQQLWFFNDAPTAVPVVPFVSAMSVFPNPCKDNYSITGFTASGNYSISLTDLSGRVLENQQIQAFTNSIQFLTPPVSAGIYLLQVRNGASTSTLRLLINQ